MIGMRKSSEEMACVCVSDELVKSFSGGICLENSRVRRSARAAGVPLWRVAHLIGVSEPTLTRWLRLPLDSDKEERILSAINELAEEVDG